MHNTNNRNTYNYNALCDRKHCYIQDQRLNVNRVREVEEGTTYASGVSHIKEADRNEIPSAPDKPTPASGLYDLNNLVVFDLETTGGGKYFLYTNTMLSNLHTYKFDLYP